MAETNNSLLVFPAPARAGRVKRSGGGGKVKMPNAASQAARLVSQLQRFQGGYGQAAALRCRNSPQDLYCTNKLGVKWPKQQLRVTHVASFAWTVEGQWASIRLAF